MPRKRRAVPWLDTRGGVYYAFWYNPERKRTDRQSLDTADPGEAQRRFAAFLTEGRPIYDTGRHAGLTVGAGLDDYWREHVMAVDDKGRAKVADRERQEDIIANLNQHFRDTLFKDVDIPMSRTYAEMRRAGVIGGRNRAGVVMAGSDSTIRRELGVLVAAANHEVRWKRLQRNDLPSIELPAESEAKERFLTRDELRILREKAADMAHLSPQYRRVKHFVDLAYYTASRREALERLTWFQVDLDHNRISLAKKGERKTKKRRPTIPIDPMLLPTLRQLKAEKISEYVLWSPGSLYREFMAVVRAANLADVTPHTLRHTRATHLLQDGVSIWDVAGLLGDTVATVQRVYGHHSVGHLGGVLAGKEEQS